VNVENKSKNEENDFNKAVNDAQGRWGHHFLDMTRVLAYKDDDGKYHYGLWDQRNRRFRVVDLQTKIDSECQRWIHAIWLVDSMGRPDYSPEFPESESGRQERQAQQLKNLSPGLFRLYQGEDEDWEALARTVRMLMFLRHLLVDSDMDSNIVNFAALRAKSTGLISKVPKLSNAIENILNEGDCVQLRPEVKGDPWHVSLALLFVSAIAESQAAWSRAVLWERFSACRAREDLQLKWPFARGFDVLRDCLDTVAIIIGYQSEFGQWARQTGRHSFVNEVTELARGNCFETKIMDALKVTAIIQEARSRKLPVTPDPASSRFRLTLGTNNKKINWQEIRKQAEKIFDDRGVTAGGLGSKYNLTWSFFAVLVYYFGVKPKELADFKEKLREQARRQWGQDIFGEESEVGDFIGFAMDRHQIEMPRLRELIVRNLKAVVRSTKSRGPKKKPSDDVFVLGKMAIPHFVAKEAEGPTKAIIVRLNDYIAAGPLLLRDSRQKPELTLKEEKGLIFDLFCALRKRFGLLDYRLGDKQTCHLPFPLMRRLLEVVYQLHPEWCVSVRVAFDNDPPETIPLPRFCALDCSGTGDEDSQGRPNESEVSELVELIANYVPAFVLNRAVSTGFHSCDIDLDGLQGRCLVRDICPSQGQRLQGIDDSEGDSEDNSTFCGKRWTHEIRTAFKRNYYEVLTDKYVRDYNTERHCVELRKHQSAKLEHVRTLGLTKKLGEYCKAARGAATTDRNLMLLGIDIGGTLTKFQLYAFNARKGTLTAVRPPFKILTPPKPEPDNKNNTRTQQDKRTPAERFSEHIVSAIEKGFRVQNIDRSVWSRINVVGISWPGPVRQNRIAGTSGILTRLGFTWSIAKNRIEDIMKIEIPKEFREAWKAVFKTNTKDIPFVSLVNDGSADGLGAILEQASLSKGTTTEEVHSQVVVKLGTGTAGAYFRDGILSPQLCEWGKILLDLAAPPDDKHEYPTGTANHYLSAKTLPSLVRGSRVEPKKSKPGKSESEEIFAIPNLTGLELDMLLKLGHRKEAITNDGLEKLRVECGIRDYAMAGDEEELDVEVFRRVYNNDPFAAAEDKLFERIEKRVGALGELAKVALRHEVRVYGGIRLRNLLGFKDSEARIFSEFLTYLEAESRKREENSKYRSPQTPQRRGYDIKTRNYRNKNKALEPIWDRITAAAEFVRIAAETLGRFLGDFIVLLHDQYGLNRVVLSGGVLSDRCGMIAGKTAVDRISKYGLDAKYISKVRWIQFDESESDPKRGRKGTPPAVVGQLAPSRKPKTIKLDQGTYGAAAYGAQELILHCKQMGMNTIERLMLAVPHNGQIVLKKLEIESSDATGKSLGTPFCLADHLLTRDEVKTYINEHCDDMGYFAFGSIQEGDRYYRDSTGQLYRSKRPEADMEQSE